ESDDAALIRVARREYERRARVPSRFVAEYTHHFGLIFDAWTRARPANDFAGLRPMLEKTVDLSRQYSSYFPGSGHIADPLIDISDEGMTAGTVRELFSALRQELV